MKQAEENHKASGGMDEDEALDNCDSMEDNGVRGDDGVLNDGVGDKDDCLLERVEPTSEGLQKNGKISPKQIGRKRKKKPVQLKPKVTEFLKCGWCIQYVTTIS